jgi:hypothetical protein
MPRIYLLRFRQKPNINASAHWAIFLADVDPWDIDEMPNEGLIFHATKDLDRDCDKVSGYTHYDGGREFRLQDHKEKLLLWHGVKDTDVTQEQLHSACEQVSRNRHMNRLTQNCQEWVKEVLRLLTSQGIIRDGVLKEIDARGFKTVKEGLLHSYFLSSLCT